MREIRFRGKCIEDCELKGQWLYGHYLKSASHFIAVDQGLVDGHFKLYQVDPETVGQSTEVTDKHRVELYKGDIFHLGDPKILYEVIWVAAGFVGKQIGSYNSYVGLSHWQERIEVIGNRFDHPHLLKGDENE